MIFAGYSGDRGGKIWPRNRQDPYVCKTPNKFAPQTHTHTPALSVAV